MRLAFGVGLREGVCLSLHFVYVNWVLADLCPCSMQTRTKTCMYRQASAFMVAAGVAAAALAGRAILRQARGGAGAGSMFQHFAGATGVGGAQKGFDEPMTRVEASKILGIRSAPLLSACVAYGLCHDRALGTKI